MLTCKGEKPLQTSDVEVWLEWRDDKIVLAYHDPDHNWNFGLLAINPIKKKVEVWSGCNDSVIEDILTLDSEGRVLLDMELV